MNSWWDGVGLCDIEVRLLAASYAGVPGAVVCLFRSLGAVLDTRCTTLVPSEAQRRRTLCIEVLFCVVAPSMLVITSYVVQTNRYAIFEISGCTIVSDQSWLSVVLLYMWPGIICLIAIYYCCLVIFRIYRYRSQFGDILRSSGTSWTKSRFFRLFSLALLILLAIVSFQTYFLYENVRWLLPDWHGFHWAHVHGKEWKYIIMISTHGSSFVDSWVFIIGGFIVFIFSGFGQDATKMYRSVLSKLGFDRCSSCLSRRWKSSTLSITGSQGGSRGRLRCEPKWPSMPRNYANPYDPFYRSLHPQQSEMKGNNPSSWPRAVWNFLRKPISSASTPCDLNCTASPASRIYPPLNSVSANAWADRSESNHSAGSFGSASFSTDEGIIQVRQFISQKSESMSPNV